MANWRDCFRIETAVLPKQYSDSKPAAGGLQSTERAILDVRNLLKDLSIHDFYSCHLPGVTIGFIKKKQFGKGARAPSLPFNLCISGHQSIPAVPIPSRANPRALAFFFKKWANSPGWEHISCLNAPGGGRRMRANALPPGNTSAFLLNQWIKCSLFSMLRLLGQLIS